MSKKPSPFDIVREISDSESSPVFQEHPSSYVPFIVNKALSALPETVLYANEMNLYWHLDHDQQYTFYHCAIRKRKRYFKWMKRDEDTPAIENIKRLFKVSSNVARQYFRRMTPQQRQHYDSLNLIGGKT